GSPSRCFESRPCISRPSAQNPVPPTAQDPVSHGIFQSQTPALQSHPPLWPCTPCCGECTCRPNHPRQAALRPI
ncbi:hypothetical protein BCR44DRAFT_1441314, partial [Catenaria anguillulae PL171]